MSDDDDDDERGGEGRGFSRREGGREGAACQRKLSVCLSVVAEERKKERWK